MINFSGLSQRSHIGKLLRVLLRVVPRSAVVRVLQGPLAGTRWVRGAGVDGYWLGTYELQKQELFASLIKPGAVVFDVGAHAGFYTLLAAKLVGTHGHVNAFEPLPENIALLKKHVELNGYTNVSIIESAVAGTDGTVAFIRGLDTFTGKVDPNGEDRMPSVSIDRCIADGRVTVPSLIKMDIEGAEFAAFTGATRLLTEHHPSILFAVHSPELRTQCTSFLEKAGYVLRPIDAPDVARAAEFLATYNEQ